MTGPIPVTVGRLQPFGNCPQCDDCHEDGGPTINKAIIITRHVGRRHPTTNQSNIKMLELMMMVIIVPIIIIIIIIGMSIPNTQSTIPRGEGGNHPHHTTGRGKQPTATPHHREGGGEEPLGGGRGGPPNRDQIKNALRSRANRPCSQRSRTTGTNPRKPEGGRTMENDPSQCFFTGAENRIRAGTGAPFARRKEQHHILYGNEHVTMTLLLTSGSNHTISL